MTTIFLRRGHVPRQLPDGFALVLRPVHDQRAYRDRVSRNIGWITFHEQMRLVRESVVCIAGTGGMGGHIAEAYVRLGVGEVRIADPETYDRSNLNRQAAARAGTVGRSKALETARELRRIVRDYALRVYPQGVREDTVASFLEGAHLVFDEIEFWKVASEILLHREARRLGIPVLNCLTVGFATILHYFAPDGMTLEELLGLSLEEALAWEEEARRSMAARRLLMERIFRCFIPDGLPAYFDGPDGPALQQQIIERLAVQGEASILATNPYAAAGIAADRGLLFLLARGGVSRDVTPLPAAPAYVCFDAAQLPPSCVRGRPPEAGHE